MVQRRGASLGLALIAMLAFCSSAHAQIVPPRTGGGGVHGGTATSTRPLPEEWRSLYDAGISSFSGGRYEEALGHFRRAHELGGPLSLLYNIALTLDRLNRTAEAIDAYQRYLDLAVDGMHRQTVQTRLTELRSGTGSTTSTTSTTSTGTSGGYAMPIIATPEPTLIPTTYDEPEPPPPAPVGPTWIASWVLLGLTAIGAGVTLGIWLDGQSQFDAFRDRCAAIGGCHQDEIDMHSAHQSETIATALLVVTSLFGAGTIASFVIEGITSTERDVRRAERPRLMLGVGPGSLSLEGTF